MIVFHVGQVILFADVVPPSLVVGISFVPTIEVPEKHK